MSDRFTKGGGLDLTLHQVAVWSRETFPNQTARRVHGHLIEEVGELMDAIAENDDGEIADNIADCLILLTSLADLYRIPLTRAVTDKMAINMARTWAYDPDRGYDHHIKHAGERVSHARKPHRDGVATPGGQPRRRAGVAALDAPADPLRTRLVGGVPTNGGGSCV